MAFAVSVAHYDIAVSVGLAASLFELIMQCERGVEKENTLRWFDSRFEGVQSVTQSVSPRGESSKCLVPVDVKLTSESVKAFVMHSLWPVALIDARAGKQSAVKLSCKPIPIESFRADTNRNLYNT